MAEVKEHRGAGKPVRRDFDLAPLEEFPPEVFRDDPVSAFVLALALAFNDLKDVQWLLARVQEGGTPEHATAEFGQWAGMKVYCNRASFAILNEVLVAILKNRRVLENEDFHEAIARLPEHAKVAWDALVTTAMGRSVEGGLGDFLTKVRNNVVSHYYQPAALSNAYQQYFFKRDKDDLNTHAYASLGPSMEATRFYFADAPPGWYYAEQFDRAVYQEALQHIQTVNIALRFVVELFLRVRAEQVALRR